MALTNALLVRYADGYTWVEDAASTGVYGRKEGFLTLGASPAGEAARIADAVLADHAYPTIATTITVQPAGAGDAPLDAWGVADTVTCPDQGGGTVAARVMAVTVTEDGMGDPVFVPELRAIPAARERQTARWLKRMSNGALGGTVASASPAVPRPPVEQRNAEVDAPPEFGRDGALVATESGKWKPRAGVTVIQRVSATLTDAGTTDTDLEARFYHVDGTLYAAVALTIPAGDFDAGVYCSVTMFGPESDYATVAIVTPGTDAATLQVQLTPLR